MIIVNGWCAVGMWEGELENRETSVSLKGEMGKDFCPNVLRPFLENID